MPRVASLTGVGTFRASEFDEITSSRVAIGTTGTVFAYEFDEDVTNIITGSTIMRFIPGVGIGTTVVVGDSIDEITENYVTNGLQFFVDAGNSLSYPGSGTTWYDLSGNGNDVTLTSTTFTTDAGGAIVSSSSASNAGNSAATTNMNFAGGGFSISVWIRHTGTVDTARVQRYFTLPSSPVEGPVLRHNSSSAASLHGYIFDSGSTIRQVDVASQIVTATYYNCVFNYDGSVFRLYKNNVQVGSLTQSITNPTPANNFSLFPSGTEWFEGNMYIAQYYNRSLSVAEIEQNYNAFRYRFGI